MRKGCDRIECQEKEVLNDDGSAGNKSGGEGGISLETSPGQVDVKQQQQNSKPNDRSLRRGSISIPSPVRVLYSYAIHRRGCRLVRAD